MAKLGLVPVRRGYWGNKIGKVCGMPAVPAVWVCARAVVGQKKFEDVALCGRLVQAPGGSCQRALVAGKSCTHLEPLAIR